MDARQIELVQRSVAQASRFGPHVAATFYAELFAIEPALRNLFKTDIVVQGDKLAAMLTQLVGVLNQPETLEPLLRDLAMRHAAYGVEARHYDIVGTALMRTLRHELGPDFTNETRAAWAAAYAVISQTMREAGDSTARRAS